MDNAGIISELYARDKSGKLKAAFREYKTYLINNNLNYPAGMERFSKYRNIFNILFKLSSGCCKLSAREAMILRRRNILVSPFMIEGIINKNNSFVALSDFHSCTYPLNKIRDYYLKEYDVVYILGDATDRGEDGNGSDGIKLLIDIMRLSKENPNRVVYIPGNHDEFLLGYARSLIGMDNNSSMDYGLNLIQNGGYQTIKDLEELKENDPMVFQELITWLGELPIQRIHRYKNKDYVLGHALFNQRLYDTNPMFCLNDLFSQPENSELRRMGQEVLWFRKSKHKYSFKEMPSADKTMVIGHTPYEKVRNLNLDLYDSNGDTIKVHCVDGGIAYDGKMFKYDGGSEVEATKVLSHSEGCNSINSQYEELIRKNRETCYQDFILGKVLKEGKDGLSDVLNGEYPREIGESGRNKVVYDGCVDMAFSGDIDTKREIYVKTFLLDYILECQIESLMRLNEGDLEDSKNDAVLLLDTFLFGTDNQDFITEFGNDGQENIVCFTNKRRVRDIASTLGTEGIHKVLHSYACGSVEEYVSKKYTLSDDGKKYVKKS